MKNFIIITVLLISFQIPFADSLTNKKKETLLNLSKIDDKPSDTKSKNKKELINDTSVIITSKKDFDWNDVLSAILGGFIGLSPLIINYFRKSKIKGRIISQYANIGKIPGGAASMIILQKVSIFSEHQNFFLKDIAIFVKFPDSAEIKCNNWVWRALNFTFNENGENFQKKLTINPTEYLLHSTVFPKEKSITGYISFSYVRLKIEKFEYIKYVFKDYKGNLRELKIDKSEIVESTQIFDDSIWQ